MVDSADEPTGGGDAAGKPAAPASLTLPKAMELALGLQKGGLLDAAEEIYHRVLALVPEHVDALHYLGLSRHQRRDFEQALALVRKAVGLAPDHVDARNNLGNMLLERGELDEAEEMYRQVLAQRPDHAHSHSNVGTVLKRKGDLVAAEASFRHALALDPQQAEAYHNLGGLLRETDRSDEALTVFQRAMALKPYDANSYRNVGATLCAVGRIGEAKGVYQRWAELEPDNPIARHMVAACSDGEVPSRATDAFVEHTFDSFAASFDEVLARLNYQAPALCAQAVADVLGVPAAALDVLDAGAGTGLCGPLLRPYARRLIGIDLSPGMLAEARKRQAYDALETAELTAFMAAHPGTFDLVVSADTLVYFGELAAALAAAGQALRGDGLLVFTVEHAVPEPPAGYRLNPHGRYSHGEAYLRGALAAAGLTPITLANAHLRTENRLPVDGLVVTARRQPLSPPR
ncbi:MAG: tetratricopeptide repeat protein [Verrucomicrobiota bacterium]